MEKDQSIKEHFPWTDFYMEVADNLLKFKNNRSELLQIMENIYVKLKLNNPITDQGEPLEDICPFTVIGSFNKGITNENRINIAKELGREIGVSKDVPTEFEGVPLLNNLNAWFFRFKKNRGPKDI